MRVVKKKAIAGEEKCLAVAMSMYAYDYVDLLTHLKWYVEAREDKLEAFPLFVQACHL